MAAGPSKEQSSTQKVAKPANWEFSGTAVAPKTGLIVVYDLEGFTSFLETPDIQRAALKYLNFIDRQVQSVYQSGRPFYLEENVDYDEISAPIHRKFLGDGAMMIFDLTQMTPEIYGAHLHNVVNRVWNIKNYFHEINEAARTFMPTAKMPARIRFGITFGTIYELTRVDGQKEYLGVPINMAARLQKYSGTAGFLVSARVDLSPSWFSEQGYVKVRPLKLRNGENEYLYIDKDDLAEAESGLFETVPIKTPPV